MSRRGKDLDQLAELEDERAFLLRSLDDLDREYEAGDVDESDYRALRDGYTARAAAVIREIEQGRAVIVPRQPIRWGRAAVITVGVVGFGVLAGVLVARSSGQDVPTAAEEATPQDKVAGLLSVARQLPPNLEKIKAYDAVLAEDPQNVEALTYRGWTFRILSPSLPTADAQAQTMKLAFDGLNGAIAIDPAYPDAHCFLAVATFRDLGDAPTAKAALDACIAADPPGEVLGLIENLKTDIDAALAGGANTTTVAAPTTT